MSFRIRYFNLLMMLVFVPTVASAGSWVKDYWKDRTSRQAQARYWLADFRKLDAQIPTLSPAEERWLKTEIDDEIAKARGQYTKRAMDAMASKEYDLRVSKPHVREIIRVLASIASPNVSDPRIEASLWTELASLFIDKGFWQAIEGLIKRGVVEKTVNGFNWLYFETHVLWAQQILNQIVLSYLSGNLNW